MLDKIKEYSGLAIFSFVLGIFSLNPITFFLAGDFYFPDVIIFFLSPSCGFIAIIIGIVSFVYCKKTKLKGKSFAVLGILFGMLGLLIIACTILFMWGFRNL